MSNGWTGHSMTVY